MLMIFSKHLLSLTISLRCFYEILYGPEADELLHLLRAIVNSSLEKEFHDKGSLEGSFSDNDIFTYVMTLT